MKVSDIVDSMCRLLEIGIAAQATRSFAEFDSEIDEFEEKFGEYRGDREAWVHYVLHFVDCWIHASNHDWQYHEPVCETDWTPLAERIIQSIRENREFSPPSLRGIRLDQL